MLFRRVLCVLRRIFCLLAESVYCVTPALLIQLKCFCFPTEENAINCYCLSYKHIDIVIDCLDKQCSPCKKITKRLRSKDAMKQLNTNFLGAVFCCIINGGNATIGLRTLASHVSSFVCRVFSRSLSLTPSV